MYPEFVQCFAETTDVEVRQIIGQMKASNSTGWDNIPINVIKANATTLAPILAHLFNKSMLQGIFPDSLKIDKIIPIFKAGCRLEIKNYRPISILPSLSKIFEKIFYKRLYAHFHVNNLFTSCQYGFRKGKCTEHALIKFVQDMLTDFDAGHIGVAAFMDLTQAFDCVNHKILFAKLRYYNISLMDQ